MGKLINFLSVFELFRAIGNLMISKVFGAVVGCSMTVLFNVVLFDKFYPTMKLTEQLSIGDQTRV